MNTQGTDPLSIFNTIADKYASTADSNPYRIYYERPAMMAMLPSIKGLKVLDVGSGTGWYSKLFCELGAEVLALDINAAMLAATASALNGAGETRQADLTQPLNFIQTGTFDVVFCSLVLHYIDDISPLLKELHRVLKSGGVLVCSTYHPFTDIYKQKTQDYFATEMVEHDWKWGELGRVQVYRRSLTNLVRAIVDQGFMIDNLAEPIPLAEMKLHYPESYDRLLICPEFIVIRSKRS